MKKEKIEFDKPLRKGICPECKKEMMNMHGEYLCLKCWGRVKYVK